MAPNLRLDTQVRATSSPLLMGLLGLTTNVDGVQVATMGVVNTAQHANMVLLPALGERPITIKAPTDSILRLHWLRLVSRRKDGPNTFAGGESVAVTNIVGLPWYSNPWNQIEDEYPLEWRLVNNSDRTSHTTPFPLPKVLSQGSQTCGRVRFEPSIVVPKDGSVSLILRNPHPTESRAVSGFIYAHRTRL
jgi:hypothetical protein